MYSFESRIRYSECDQERQLTMASLVDYLQDCTTFHSESIGLGLDYFKQTGRVWLLSGWQIVIDKMPVFNDKVKICTQAYDFKGFYGLRNFWIEDEAGNMLIKANSIWTYMNMIQGRPEKVSKEEGERYQLDQKLDMDYAPRKIPLPEDMKAAAPVPVHPDMIDTNNHVNNGQYIRIAAQILEEVSLGSGAGTKPVIGQIRAEYKKSAVLGDIMYPFFTLEGNDFYVDLRDDKGTTFAIILFACK